MRATVIAIIVILVSAGLVGLAIVYTSMARGPLIRIRILDEEGRPIEGALVQAFAITCPGSSTPAVEVLREKTGFNGAVVLKLEGKFEEVVRQWREYLDRVYEGRSKRFFHGNRALHHLPRPEGPIPVLWRNGALLARSTPRRR